MPNDADRAGTPAGVFGALGSLPRVSKLTAVTPAHRNLTTERAYVTAPVQVTAQPCPFGRVPPSRLR
jgi:hypothetical protein